MVVLSTSGAEHILFHFSLVYYPLLNRQSASSLRASAEPPPCMLGPFGGLPRWIIAVHSHFQPSTGTISPIACAGGCCKGLSRLDLIGPGPYPGSQKESNSEFGYLCLLCTSPNSPHCKRQTPKRHILAPSRTNGV